MTLKATDISLTAAEGSDSPKEAVLLLHGMTGTPGEVRELAEFLHARGFDCFAPCLSGHSSTIQELKYVPLAQWLADVEAAFAFLEDYSRIHLIGQSFGSLLALYLAERHPSKISSVVALSLPWRFRSRFEEMVLNLLSFLPDSLLDKLGLHQKSKREGVRFRVKRLAYDHHSIGAAARVMQLQRKVRTSLYALKARVLLLHDPMDHHLLPDSVWEFRAAASGAEVLSRWMYGGYHELTLGPCYEQILEEVLDFLLDAEKERSYAS